MIRSRARVSEILNRKREALRGTGQRVSRYTRSNFSRLIIAGAGSGIQQCSPTFHSQARPGAGTYHKANRRLGHPNEEGHRVLKDVLS